MDIKQQIKRVLPGFILKFYYGVKHHLDDKRNVKRSTRDVFVEIYRGGKWGKRFGRFYSGVGSSAPMVTWPYVRMMIEFIRSFDKKPRVVDLGCGDFSIGKHLIDYCSEYIGVDIVPDLIKVHKADKHGEHVKFICLDIIEDDLPNGDICFLRQVLQHLSNEQIAKILPKLKQYKTTFITEHYPTDNPAIVPNKDIVHGSRVRVCKNSGVYLDKTPFDIPSNCLQLILEVPGIGLSKGFDPGVIRTYKLEFSS